MDFGYSEDEERFRQEVRDFIAEAWTEEQAAARWADDPGRSRAFREKLAARGWLALGWPDEYGGRSVSRMERYILSQEMTRVRAPLPLYITNVIGPLLIKYGSPELKRELLPRVAAGEVNFVLGFTEPETGSDLANLSCRAVREGDGYVVNGQKLYGRPDPGDVMFLAVRTDPEAPIRDGISILLVDVPSDGLTVTTMPTLGGMRVGATYYDDVYVPRERLLGEENRGWHQIRETMSLDRAAGIAYGHLPVLFDQILDYVRTHSVDGRPLAQEPWVRERIAQLAIELEGAQLLQDVTASRTAAGDDLRSESSVLKVFCTEFEGRLAAFGMELVGPLAPVLGDDAGDVHPLVSTVNRTYRANAAITIAGGTNEIQRNIIALSGLRLPR